MDDVKTRVLKIFREIAGKLDIEDRELLKKEYLDAGILDSLQVIELITKLEEEFGIQFSHEDLESELFRTCEGIGQLIEKQIGEKS
ncbi:acyl carrier protein [Candidatus Micrarchaeota archaeon]|nr:acyl carrier protein [Candidatus Micrarchaeota archaeon]